MKSTVEENGESLEENLMKSEWEKWIFEKALLRK